MGRGGPAEPELAEVTPTVERCSSSRASGRHAASDYLEDAALARVVTVGCRRCGGGLAGAPVVSNVGEGARLAAERSPTSSSSRAAARRSRRSRRDRRVLVAGAHQPPELVDRAT